ncbi:MULTISPECIES: hypothetical protein [Giesbergeria]|uniref:Uncharacterized protein n=1 Tax=Giesbergeria sinuosa TaxID=80883 RepID=A0ABV9QF93_9BURK
MSDKKLKFWKKPITEDRVAVLRRGSNGDECKFQFMLWADGTSLDISGIHGGEPVFRPAICAWEAWKGVWALMSSGPDMQKTSAAESAKLRERIRELELIEEGAQDAFAAVVEKKRQLEAECARLRKLLDGAHETIRKQASGLRY